MPNRFPPLAPQEPVRQKPMARAMPAPSLPWVDFILYGAVLLVLRLM